MTIERHRSAGRRAPPRARPHPSAGQSGMTLIEVLIAMVVSTFVLISIGYTFVSQRALERHRGALASIQDGARVGLDMLALDLRQAGYVGCNSNLQRNTVEKTQFETVVLPVRDPAVVPVGTENFTIDANNAVRVFNASAPAAVWGGSVPPNVVADTHVIEIRYATAEGASLLSAPIAANGLSLTTESTVALGRGDDAPTSANRLGLLSDCASGLVVLADGVTGNTVSTGALPINFNRCQAASRVGATCFYWPATALMPIRVVQYYVADTGTAAQPQRGLYMRKRIMQPDGITWNAPVQLVDGMQTLRVTGLGLDVAAPAAPTWGVTREVLETTSPTAVETLAAGEWPRVLRMDVRFGMRAQQVAGTDGKAVVRNFETSFSVRARAPGEVI